MKIATLEFVDYAMKWWHSYVTNICYNKRPPVVSWNNLVECMCFRFVPPHFRKDLMLKLQRFQQGTLSVDANFKELETLLLKVDLRESEEPLIPRFVSRLRRDIDESQVKEVFIDEGRGHSPSHLKFFLLVFSKLKEDIK